MGTKRLNAKQRARVVQLVERDKLSRNIVAERFGVSYVTVLKILREPRGADAQG